jgi:hypothetical protein
MTQLAEKFQRLSTSDLTRISKFISEPIFNTVSPIDSDSNSRPAEQSPYGLCNAASIFQDLLLGRINAAPEIPLTGAQRGLVLSLTPQGFVVHWPGRRPDYVHADSSRVVVMAEILPFQDGEALPEDQHSLTDILPSSTTMESANFRGSSHTREVFVAPGRGRSPLHEPTPPDENSVDERLSSISPDVLPVPMKLMLREPQGRRRISRGKDAASGQ